MECMWDGSEAMDAVSAREDVEVAAAPRRETDFWNGVSPPPDSSSGLYPFDWVCAVTALRLLLDVLKGVWTDSEAIDCKFATAAAAAAS